jgi:hypothetical protein
MNHKSKLHLAILKNEDPYDHLNWVKACEDHKDAVEYKVVDLMGQSWLGAFEGARFDCLLAKPGARTSVFRSAYQERIEILAAEFGYPVFPFLPELRIYENKRYLSYWLEANRISHPETHVFYDKNETLAHVAACRFPLVGKINVGASGDGVRILENREVAREYIELAFSSGLRNRTGPKMQRNLLANKLKKLARPKALLNRLKSYRQIAADAQIGFVIFQEFIPHDFEWRIVRIGDSFFGHKKLKSGAKASGSLLKRYEDPPHALLDFVKDITDRYQFYSQAVDIFIDPKGRFLINELQCIFGQSDPYQMKVDGKIGRYLRKGNEWVFEEGDFNKNESFDLRVAHVIQMYGDKRWQE